MDTRRRQCVKKKGSSWEKQSPWVRLAVVLPKVVSVAAQFRWKRRGGVGGFLCPAPIAGTVLVGFSHLNGKKNENAQLVQEPKVSLYRRREMAWNRKRADVATTRLN